jgi:hypothetical protein
VTVDFYNSIQSGVIESPDSLTDTCNIVFIRLPTGSGLGSLIEFKLTSSSLQTINSFNQIITVTDADDNEQEVGNYPDIFRSDDSFHMIHFEAMLKLKYWGSRRESFNLFYSGKNYTQNQIHIHVHVNVTTLIFLKCVHLSSVTKLVSECV